MRPSLRVVTVVLSFPHRWSGDFLWEVVRRRELGVDGVVLAGGLEAVGKEGFGGGVVEGGGGGGCHGGFVCLVLVSGVNLIEVPLVSFLSSLFFQGLSGLVSDRLPF